MMTARAWNGHGKFVLPSSFLSSAMRENISRAIYVCMGSLKQLPKQPRAQASSPLSWDKITQTHAALQNCAGEQQCMLLDSICLRCFCSTSPANPNQLEVVSFPLSLIASHPARGSGNETTLPCGACSWVPRPASLHILSVLSCLTGRCLRTKHLRKTTQEKDLLLPRIQNYYFSWVLKFQGGVSWSRCCGPGMRVGIMAGNIWQSEAAHFMATRSRK